MNKLLRGALLCLGAARLVLCGCVSDEHVGRRTDAVYGGALDESNRERNAVVVPDAIGCSATYVTPNVVITADHCRVGVDGMAWAAPLGDGWQSEAFPFGVHVGTVRTGARDARVCAWSHVASAVDVNLWRLDRRAGVADPSGAVPIDVVPMAILTRLPPGVDLLGAAVDAIGFGSTGFGGLGGPRSTRATIIVLRASC